jgi:hypothetical protein
MQTEKVIVIGGRRYVPRKPTADRIHKSIKTLSRWEQDGTGPPVTRVGRDIYYAEDDLAQWLLAQRRA